MKKVLFCIPILVSEATQYTQRRTHILVLLTFPVHHPTMTLCPKSKFSAFACELLKSVKRLTIVVFLFTLSLYRFLSILINRIFLNSERMRLRHIEWPRHYFTTIDVKVNLRIRYKRYVVLSNTKSTVLKIEVIYIWAITILIVYLNSRKRTDSFFVYLSIVTTDSLHH